MKSMKFSSLLGDAKTVVMLGMCKNAGKTTALCRLIREFGETDAAPPAATSIGRDGETRDLVTGTEKPPIYMYEGMLAATARELLPLADVSREILAGTGLYTSLGEVMIFRARSDGFVQLAGPGIVEHLEPLKKMLRELGAGRILIDGVDYRERSQHWLHSNLGYVQQDPHLFSGSIMENIRYGRLDATDEEVKAAARLVSADKVDLSGRPLEPS